MTGELWIMSPASYLAISAGIFVVGVFVGAILGKIKRAMNKQ